MVHYGRKPMAVFINNEFFKIQFTEAAARIHGGTPIHDNGSCQLIYTGVLLCLDFF